LKASTSKIQFFVEKKAAAHMTNFCHRRIHQLQMKEMASFLSSAKSSKFRNHNASCKHDSERHSTHMVHKKQWQGCEKLANSLQVAGV
jgi:hypothetical protein